MSKNHPALPWWSRPIGMGLLALALMVGGWNLSIWQPMTSHEREQADRLDELRRQAQAEHHQRLADRLAQAAQRVPPYQTPGRLLIFLGLLLFVAAGVRMYQAPPETSEDSEEDTGVKEGE
jgi:type II secretory pathway component PulM